MIYLMYFWNDEEFLCARCSPGLPNPYPIWRCLYCEVVFCGFGVGSHMYQHHKESKHSLVISCRYMYLTKDFRVSTNWCLESFMLFIFLFWLALNVFLFVTFSKNDPVVFCYLCKINANIHQVIQQLQAFSKVSFLFWLLNFCLIDLSSKFPSQLPTSHF